MALTSRAKKDMLSKEQVLEIISYCDTHGVQRKARLQELGISECLLQVPPTLNA